MFLLLFPSLPLTLPLSLIASRRFFSLFVHSTRPSLFLPSFSSPSPSLAPSLLFWTLPARCLMSMPTTYDPDGDVDMDSVPATAIVKDSSIDPLEVILNPSLLKSTVCSP